ncbi:hypothetical protein WL88_15970 [Burkholderia diffusa]|uniref:Uncharacterized protein n=1 Tax=Burkholderia diffusa TaxID=488732 RepID=A0AAW3PGA2_9BURK|nr:hypothetical protein [Burkholderia diffusa]KWF27072.1 hypothetical protein WL85_02160 [Burkholderia diffusa]KWF33215.1 hypothetical protein WL86_28090 [Burkholderia diffusa]KWF46073.1 hypothetical protein WL87_05710 [Burkholderia diffusa]KWF52836.1 hypothetical protein WL88_15970 [Burkholderia diffusa]
MVLDFVENDARRLRARMHVRIIAANEGRACVAFVRGPDGAEIDEEYVVAGAYLIGDQVRLHVRSVFSPKRTMAGCRMRSIPSSSSTLDPSASASDCVSRA